VLRALAQAAPHLRVLAGGLAASIRMRTRSRRSDKNTFAFVAKAPGSLKRWRSMLSVANRRRPLRMRLCCDRVGRIAAEMARWQTAAFNCHRREARAAEGLAAKSRYGFYRHRSSITFHHDAGHRSGWEYLRAVSLHLTEPVETRASVGSRPDTLGGAPLNRLD
jgi:hypothetical protein